jgi:hypothetical protein
MTGRQKTLQTRNKNGRQMAFDEDLTAFIRSTFRSVWSLELLLFLTDHADRSWSRSELVEATRSSDLIVAQSLDGLIAAGVVSITADGCVRHAPASADIAAMVESTKLLYGRSPNSVRRLIISTASGGLTAFADAFRFRKD